MDSIRIVKAFLARLANASFVSRAQDPARERFGPVHDPLASPRTAQGGGRSFIWAALPPAWRPSGTTGSDPGVGKGSGRTSRQRDGDEGEGMARRYLELAGLTFVAANVRYRDGELDLVMRDARGAARHAPVLVFIEVRRRARGTHGGAAGSVTAGKRRRVAAAAAHFLVGLGLRSLPACRFDVVTLEGDPAQGFCIEWTRDAFRDEG